MNNIREVYGIGHKKANDLKRFYNIKTVRSLRLHIKKIPDIVTETQRTGLKYHNRIIPAMHRREATKHVDFIKKHLPTAIIAGSYRRELKKVRDIDVLITGNLKKLLIFCARKNTSWQN